MKGLDLSEKTDGLLSDPGDLISPLIKVTNGKAANNNKMTNKVNSDRLNSNSASPGSTSGKEKIFSFIFRFCLLPCFVSRRLRVRIAEIFSVDLFLSFCPL